MRRGQPISVGDADARAVLAVITQQHGKALQSPRLGLTMLSPADPVWNNMLAVSPALTCDP
jgi:hypothetical protein